MEPMLLFSCRGTVHKQDSSTGTFAFLVPDIASIQICSSQDPNEPKLGPVYTLSAITGNPPTPMLELKVDQHVSFDPPKFKEANMNILKVTTSSGLEIYGFNIIGRRDTTENFSRWLERITFKEDTEALVYPAAQAVVSSSSTSQADAVYPNSLYLSMHNGKIESQIPFPDQYNQQVATDIPSDRLNQVKSQGPDPSSRQDTLPSLNQYISMHVPEVYRLSLTEHIYESIPASTATGIACADQEKPPELPPRPMIMQKPKFAQKEQSVTEKTPQSDLITSHKVQESTSEGTVVIPENIPQQIELRDETAAAKKGIKKEGDQHKALVMIPSEDADDKARGIQSSWQEHPLGLQKKESKIDNSCDLLARAIANGAEEDAVKLCKELAQRKVKLAIQALHTDEEKKALENIINITVQIADKQSEEPIFTKLDVDVNTNISQLKRMVQQKLSLPIEVQRWVIGKRLPMDNETLKQLRVLTTGTVVFLYLLSSKDAGIPKPEIHGTQAQNQELDVDFALPPRDYQRDIINNEPPPLKPSQHGYRSAPDPPPNFAADIPTVSNGPSTLQLGIASQSIAAYSVAPPGLVSLQNNPYGHQPSHPTEQPDGMNSPIAIYEVPTSTHQLSAAQPDPPHQSYERTSRKVQGWKCPTCTFINLPTRPGCTMCSTDRPADYKLPVDFDLDDAERERLKEEEILEQLAYNASD